MQFIQLQDTIKHNLEKKVPYLTAKAWGMSLCWIQLLIPIQRPLALLASNLGTYTKEVTSK